MPSHLLQSIGTFYCESIEKYSQAHQPFDSLAKTGLITLEADHNYEMALSDLEGFEKIWLIFYFHKTLHWKPKVFPPRHDGSKKGVFSTRSPHRPNQLGLSCVDLIKVEGRKLWVANHDLLNETPIYDIKPYLPYSDAHPNAKHGWVESLPNHSYELIWDNAVKAEREWLMEQGLDINELIEATLRYYPQENAKRRIKKVSSEANANTYELASKTWRVSYSYTTTPAIVRIHHIYSGYDSDTLKGKKASKWQDVPLHQKYNAHFNK